MGAQKDLLRFATIGSVDDGKSTLIGRLLFETGSVYQDHLASVEAASKRQNRDFVDLALITDGLRAEREQGITIDVAYRHFSTEKRKYIIADTPGHEQYTRNMVTGASTARLVILLIDAKTGIQTQSKRHAFISSLLGVENVIVAVNKMDLVGHSQSRFREICQEYEEFCAKLNLSNLSFVPVSALKGDNIVRGSENMPWYDGSTVLEYLENTYVGSDRNLVDFRMPVQLVARPNSEFRGYAGSIVSGVIRRGEEVMVLPGEQRSTVASLVGGQGEVDYAFVPQAITVVLADELDISRGDVLVHPRNRPKVIREAEAMLVWMAAEPLRTNQPYLIKSGTNTVRATFPEIVFRIDPEKLHRQPVRSLGLNEIGRVVIHAFRPLVCDEYARNKHTGSFIVIDPQTYGTVGAGIIIDRGEAHLSPATVGAKTISKNIAQEHGEVTRKHRERLLGQNAATIWLTGLSGAGKSTLAYALEQELTALGNVAYVIDGDNVRHGLNRDLGFAPADRTENIRRVAEVAALMQDAGVIVICAFISPYADDRDGARRIIGDSFLEVFVDASLEVCEQRDRKGLYKKARAGQVADFTGISAPYEAPTSPDIHISSERRTVDENVQIIIDDLRQRGVMR